MSLGIPPKRIYQAKDMNDYKNRLQSYNDSLALSEYFNYMKKQSNSVVLKDYTTKELNDFNSKKTFNEQKRMADMAPMAVKVKGNLIYHSNNYVKENEFNKYPTYGKNISPISWHTLSNAADIFPEYKKPTTQILPPILTKPSYEDYYKTIPSNKNNTSDYDLEAAYKNLPYEKMKKFAESNEHLPDTYKKPTHPTFSNESIYSNDKTQGGTWTVENGKDVFNPSQHNIDNLGGIDKFNKWMSEHEPGVIIKLPEQKQVIPQQQFQFNTGSNYGTKGTPVSDADVKMFLKFINTWDGKNSPQQKKVDMYKQNLGLQ